MQTNRSRRRHTKKQVRRQLTQLKRALKMLDVNLNEHQKPLCENLAKADQLGEKLEWLWEQPVYFDELMGLVHRHHRRLEDVRD